MELAREVERRKCLHHACYKRQIDNPNSKCQACSALGLVGYLPILIVFLLFANFLTTYLLFTIQNDVDPFLPYISDTGTKKPESCIFALAQIYLRYRIVAALNRGVCVRIRRCNRLSLAFGVCSCVGMMLVANFQETAVLSVHLIGAMLCFTIGLLYMLAQSFITYLMYPVYNAKFVIYSRAILTAFGFVAFAVFMGGGAVAGRQYRTKHPGKHVPIPWYDTTQPGYSWHIVSAVGEWLLATVFAFFFLTYMWEFSSAHVSCSIQVVPTVTHLHL